MNILIAGRIGSGKTKISKAVADELGYRWNSYSTTIKNIARERGLPIVRDALQQLGQSLIDLDSEALTRRVLAEATPIRSGPVVIDGLRHSHIPKVIRGIIDPDELIVIFVDVDDSVRRARLRERDNLTELQIDQAEEHATEVQVTTVIRELADYIVDNSGQPRIAVEKIVEKFRL